MPYCSYCGERVEEDHSYCRHCGEELKGFDDERDDEYEDEDEEGGGRDGVNP